jgi:hypothetical protein
MTRSASRFRRGSEFDNFLFAPIVVEENGTPLSVLSAFARQNLDPWQEAANLARLPIDIAVHRLAVWIGGLPNNPSEPRDYEAIAACLIASLPRKPRANIRVGAMELGTDPKAGSVIVSLYVVFMILALWAHWFAQTRKPMARVDNVQATAAAAILKTPPSGP